MHSINFEMADAYCEIMRERLSERAPELAIS